MECSQDIKRRLAQRYSQLGGTARVLQGFVNNKFTLQSIAARAGVSRETVRNDLKHILGRSGYQDVIVQRRPKPKGDQEFNCADAAAYLRKKGRAGDDLPRLARASLLIELSNHTKSLTAWRSPSGVFRFSIGECPVYLRVAVPRERHHEYSMGLFRFRPGIYREPGLAIFGMCKQRYPHEVITVYLFRSDEINGIRSLNLRFFKFERQSKWDFARERWRLLSIYRS